MRQGGEADGDWNTGYGASSVDGGSEAPRERDGRQQLRRHVQDDRHLFGIQGADTRCKDQTLQVLAVCDEEGMERVSSFHLADKDPAPESDPLSMPTTPPQPQEEVHAAELERTFIAIKPDGVQRGLIAEIISRFERKGYKLVAIKLVVPSNEFAQQHYHDLKERPFFSGLCDFLSSGPVLAMVWEGEGVIKYGRKLIGATDPQKSEPGTIRGDLAVVVGRNIIHGSDGPETAKDEIDLWFSPTELISYANNAEKWIYGVN
ncbi:hypothetical protein M5K25_005121 [Dendrobium thyrsiflorum]|uniref:Nucleoside diphosphate kinase n=1 Tax=Dendrobium thyrsiflorum TaxID=117978 RepID=A0ABD0VHT2_DENTH